MVSKQSHTYSAFLSYSRNDEVFVTRLQKQLERYRIPRSFRNNGKRFRIFRDTESAGVGDLPKVLRKALNASDYLIVVCSPDARRSEYVSQEIDYFANTKGADRIIPILVAGRPNAEVKKKDKQKDKSFPDILCKYLTNPLAADFRFEKYDHLFDKRRQYRESLFQIIAKLLGTEKTEGLVRRDRWRRLAVASLASLMMTLFLGAAGSAGLLGWASSNGIETSWAAKLFLTRFGIDALSPNMVDIKADTFQMGNRRGGGSSDELPVHEVDIKHNFKLSKYEVTFEDYEPFVKLTGQGYLGDKGLGRGRRPANYVSWNDAKEYAKWLTKQTGKEYRLPTEAEWEYAARSGGQDEVWAGTSDEKELKEYAVFQEDSTHPVGMKKPNGLGLYDMSGNVREWVEDCWHKNYEGAPKDGSAWLNEIEGDCTSRMHRGGSWVYDLTDWDLRTSNRGSYEVDDRNDDIGFRLAQDMD